MRQNKFASVVKPLALLAAGALTLMSASAARAADPVVITSDGLQSVVSRFEQFSTRLQARVPNEPKTSSEVTVVGVAYKWSGGGEGLRLTSTTGESSGLDSGFPPSYTGNGQKSVTVRCTVTYTLTDKDGTALNPITVSGSADVKFFVRVPVEARNISADPMFGTVLPWAGRSLGHEVTYDFMCMDNQRTPAGYGLGKISETFDGYSPNPAYTNALKAYPGAPGPPKTTVDTKYTWTDRNRWDIYGWDIEQPGSEAIATAADFDNKWFSFVQTFHCLEQKPPYNVSPPPPFDQDTPLKPSYTVEHQRDRVVRTVVPPAVP